MKINRRILLLLTGAFSLAPLCSLHAATPATNETSAQSIAKLYPNGKRAKDVIGTPVLGSSGENLGKISDLLVDAASGQIVYVLVSTGGVLGIGDTLRAVPIGALERDRDTTVRMNLPLSDWKTAPVYSDEQLVALSDQSKAEYIYKYYRQSWEPLPKADQSRIDPAAPRLVKASTLFGRDVQSADQTIGEVEDLVVKLDDKSTALLVDPKGGVVGSAEKYVVPFRSVAGSAAGTALSTRLSRDDFRSAKDMTSSAFSDQNENAVYRWSIDSGGSDHSDQRSDIASRPAREAAPVDSVRRALREDRKLSSSETENVRVSEENNRLILRGTVPSSDAKDRVEDRAEAAASGWRVDNQLEVRR
jgi:sporulation protein YlmC with PRC-barrel domain